MLPLPIASHVILCRAVRRRGMSLQGTVLIAVNPLRRVEDPPMESYMNRPLNPEMPHPYAIAEVRARWFICSFIPSFVHAVCDYAQRGWGRRRLPFVRRVRVRSDACWLPRIRWLRSEARDASAEDAVCPG